MRVPRILRSVGALTAGLFVGVVLGFALTIGHDFAVEYVARELAGEYPPKVKTPQSSSE